MINSISFRSAVQPERVTENKISTPQLRSSEESTLERVPVQDNFEKKDDTIKKVAIGSMAAIVLATAADFIFAKGKHVKKLFGIAEKGAKESKPEAKTDIKPDSKPEVKTGNNDYENWLKEQSDAKKAIEESNKRNEKWVEEQHKLKEEEYSNQWNKELKAKEETELKAKLEAEKAAKAAKEKLETEYKTEMDKIAQEKAIELKNKWNKKLDIYTAIYNKGFKAISKGKKVTQLEDGTYKVVINGKKNSIEYYSKDGVHLDRINILNKDGSVQHEINFGRDNGRTGKIYVFNQAGKEVEYISFCTELNRHKGDRICDWYNNNGFEAEGLKTLYMDGKQVEWNALPPENVADGLRLTNWIELK